MPADRCSDGQGKYFNDPKVLLEAAHASGLKDAEKAVNEPEEGREQAGPAASLNEFLSCLAER